MLFQRHLATAALRPLLVLFAATLAHAQPTTFNLIEATVPEMQAAMDSGLISAEYLTQQYLKRIEAYDEQGPKLNPILSLNSAALETARALDLERQESGPRGPLHGIPILLKDNIDTFDMPTTAGAVALKDSIPPDDAFLTQRLRDAGAVILGKANLSEFAYFLTIEEAPNGFSGVGGQTLNPYNPGVFDPLGSSTGSAVGVSANMAAIAVGTETLGSIVSPSAVNSIVGIRPTQGLISRDGIIPISHTQDTAGPMGRTVTDAAIMLGAMTGVDPNDPVTAASEGRFLTDYQPFLKSNGLDGKRIGVVRHPVLEPDFFTEKNLPLVQDAIEIIKSQGATIIDDLDMSSSFFPTFDLWGPDVPAVMTYEFQGDMNAYLASLGEDAPVKTLADIIEFNKANPDAIPYGQSLLELAESLGGDLTSEVYIEQLESGKRLFGEEGFGRLLSEHNLDALLFSEGWGAFGALPGYPTISVPGGYGYYSAEGFPNPIEFLGAPFTESTLIEIAYAYEQASQLRVTPESAPPIPGDFVGPGDFDTSGGLDATDIDMMISAIQAGQNESPFDLTGDQLVNADDLREFVTSPNTLHTHFGDSNLDGEFDSGDFVTVFVAGEYEDGVAGNSTWASGDWNGDDEFDSKDLTFVMQEGGYEQGRRVAQLTAANAVPEPTSSLAILFAILLCSFGRRR